MDVEDSRDIADDDVGDENQRFDAFGVFYVDLAVDASIQSFLLGYFLSLGEIVTGYMDPVSWVEE